MNRRAFLSGLIATPAIVSASSLMPIRGIVMPVLPPMFIPTGWALITEWRLPPHGPRPSSDSTAPLGTFKFVNVSKTDGDYRQYWMRFDHPEQAILFPVS